MNQYIRSPLVRVVSATGEMLGEMPPAAALELADAEDLDLVEVSNGAEPPVCRIMDYDKVRFAKQKKSAGHKHQSQLKQVRLGAKTGQHDIDVKIRRAKEFLARGDKVKLNVMFRGRENAHHDRGRAMLQSIIEALAGVATVEQSPRMESGRMMSALLTAGGSGKEK